MTTSHCGEFTDSFIDSKGRRVLISSGKLQNKSWNRISGRNVNVKTGELLLLLFLTNTLKAKVNKKRLISTRLNNGDTEKWAFGLLSAPLWTGASFAPRSVQERNLCRQSHARIRWRWLIFTGSRTRQNKEEKNK